MKVYVRSYSTTITKAEMQEAYLSNLLHLKMCVCPAKGQKKYSFYVQVDLKTLTFHVFYKGYPSLSF